MMSQFTEACMRNPALMLYSRVILFELYSFYSWYIAISYV